MKRTKVRAENIKVSRVIRRGYNTSYQGHQKLFTRGDSYRYLIFYMKLHKICTALYLITIALSSNAFAIDQLILKNGTIIEGKILSDVPNRHVDIQLVNGGKKRFQQTEVSSVERDVPSNTDSRMSGSTSQVFAGATLGGYLVNSTGSTISFNWGGRFGVNTAQLGDFSKLAFALSYNRSSDSDTSLNASASISELMLQMLFRKIGNTGFYMGPEIGLLFVSASIGSASGSTNRFDIGGLAGYDYYFNDSFSMGPEVHFTSVSEFSNFKFLLGGTVHF